MNEPSLQDTGEVRLFGSTNAKIQGGLKSGIQSPEALGIPTILQMTNFLV